MKLTATKVFLRVERLENRDTPAALSPAQVRTAYGFSQIAFATGTGAAAGDGRGTTIAIVDAYNDPYVASDLDTFDKQFSINGGGQSLYQQYGAASSVLTVATPQGRPANSAGWSGEIALDVEWAHAIAPGAKILLVEARSSSLGDLISAINYARSQQGVVAVSLSWGGSEFSGETSAAYQNIFTTPAGHTGVTFVAASGDDGAPATWPAVSTNVLAVGGTRLTVDGSGNYVGESAWGFSGGGPSTFFSKPGYQASAYSGTRRGTPDVAYDANPSTGFWVYNTYDGGWEQIGGTSAGAPQWAALVAVADQGRALRGLGPLDGATQTLPAIYALSSADFHDVTNGSNGYRAGTGYDLATGRGSPVANLVVRDLVGGSTTVTPSATKTTTTTATQTAPGRIFRAAVVAAADETSVRAAAAGLADVGPSASAGPSAPQVTDRSSASPPAWLLDLDRLMTTTAMRADAPLTLSPSGDSGSDVSPYPDDGGDAATLDDALIV